MVSLYHWGMRPLKTLERVFSKAGIASRTDARNWIGAGRVRVNGKVAENPDQWVDIAKDRITLDGKPLRAAKPVYILLYKPKGYLTTWRDPEGRPTVYDLARDAGTWLSPVGRLDLDTSGLLLLTNDTAFAERIANPDRKIPKTYQVKASTLLSEEQLETFRRRAVPVPGGVIREGVELTNDARLDIPSTIVCTGYTSEQYKSYARDHAPAWLAGLIELHDITWIDLPTSHWPMWSRPRELAQILGDVAKAHAPAT